MTSLEDLEPLLQSFFKDPSLKIFFSPAWGSQNSGYRSLMSSELQGLPQYKNSLLHKSISHCQGVGLAVFSKNPVGVDAEVTSRPTAKILARVCTEDEISAAPSLAALWSAKEAAFKALKSFNQPKVISKIIIQNWSQDSHFETFQLNNSNSFGAPSAHKGLIFVHELHTFAFFQFSS